VLDCFASFAMTVPSWRAKRSNPGFDVCAELCQAQSERRRSMEPRWRGPLHPRFPQGARRGASWGRIAPATPRTVRAGRQQVGDLICSYHWKSVITIILIWQPPKRVETHRNVDVTANSGITSRNFTISLWRRLVQGKRKASAFPSFCL
jgi:hypothetical protein